MILRLHCLLVAALIPTAYAQSPPPAPRVPPPTAVIPPPTRAAVYLINKYLTGQRVIGVGYGWMVRDAVLDEGALARAKDLPGKLKVICNTVSDGSYAMMPFAVGNAYVVAPATMEVIDPDATSTVLDVMGEGAQLDCVLASLTPNQVKQLGASSGLAVTDLTAEAQRILAHALRPPLRMPDGSVVEKPLEWRNARLRASLRMQAAWIPTGGGGASSLHGPESDLDGLSPLHLSPQIRDTNLAVLRKAPNAYRPSDLTGASYQQAIGIEGVMTLGAALKQVAKVTGLRLRPANVFKDVPVFLGTRNLTAGEVIDGLRLGATGAFRKLDNEYIFAWDRIGLGALQQFAQESANAGSEQDAIEKISQATSSPIRELLATALPFESIDPLALTSEQRTRLFDTSNNPAFAQTVDATRWDTLHLKIPFPEMTPKQRQYLSDLSKTAQVYEGPANALGELRKRTVTDADLQNSYLENSAYVSLSLSIPGRGWTRLMSFGYGELSGREMALKGARRKEAQEMEASRAESMAEDQKRIDAWQPTPVSLLAPRRGLMIPAMGPAHVAELGREMRRHGLNVLFYPALNDGYATFSNKAFPLDPILRGRNGLANAVAAMTPLGIRVVPYVSVLAWKRFAGVHWLDKHPGWLERDILNRTRLEYLADHQSWKNDPVLAVLGSTEFVRASEPMVAAKLNALVADLAPQVGLAGVAFVDWNPESGSAREMPGQPPPLGFSVPDRIETLRREGEDPVDQPMDSYGSGAPFWPEAFGEMGIDPGIRDDGSTPPRVAEQFSESSVGLVNALLQASKAAHPDWTTYVVKEPNWPLPPTANPAARAKAPVGDVTVLVSRWLNPELKTGLLLPVWPRTLAPSDVPEAMRKYPSITMLTATEPGATPKPLQSPMVIFDFRAAPDEITDSLQWIAAPGSNG